MFATESLIVYCLFGVFLGRVRFVIPVAIITPVIIAANDPPILIGNFANKKSFYEYVGGAFVDRLSESGVVYETKGRSYRFDKNNDKKSDIESYTEKRKRNFR